MAVCDCRQCLHKTESNLQRKRTGSSPVKGQQLMGSNLVMPMGRLKGKPLAMKGMSSKLAAVQEERRWELHGIHGRLCRNC